MFHVKRFVSFLPGVSRETTRQIKKNRLFRGGFNRIYVFITDFNCGFSCFYLVFSILAEEILRFVLFKDLKTFYNAVEIVARVVIDVDSSFIVVAERVYFCGENALQSRNHVL